MFYQYQNEIIATIAIITLIAMYFFSRNNNKKSTNIEEENDTLSKKRTTQKKKEKTLSAEEKSAQEQNSIPTLDEMQDEDLLGTQEGDFQSKNAKSEPKEKKVIHKRALIQHGKITKESFTEFSGQKLLIAEDNFINQKVLTGLLAGSGIEITLADNGQEALDVLEKDSNFFMILMDAHMPIVDGFEATRKIRQNPHYDHIVIVALSGDTAADDIRKMKDAGMDETLEKPLRMDSLYNMMYIYSGTLTDNKNNEDYVEVIMTQALRGDQGLAICGGDELFYKEILQEFVKDYIDSAHTLHTLLHEHKLREADKFLLDILGITANIGALNLNKIAKEIKLALSDTSEKSYLTLLEQYKEQLNTLIKDIKEYL